MDYSISAGPVSAQPLAVVRRTARVDQLSAVVPKACGEVWDAVKAAGVKGGRLVAVYFDDAINLEVGVEVPEEVHSDRVIASATPAGFAATVAHIGPYNRLGDAHEALTDWCTVNGYKLAGPRWEVYGHGDVDPPRTDIFALLDSPTGAG